MDLMLDDGFQDQINQSLSFPMRFSAFFKGNVVGHHPRVKNLEVTVRPGYDILILGEKYLKVLLFPQGAGASDVNLLRVFRCPQVKGNYPWTSRAYLPEFLGWKI